MDTQEAEEWWSDWLDGHVPKFRPDVPPLDSAAFAKWVGQRDESLTDDNCAVVRIEKVDQR